MSSTINDDAGYADAFDILQILSEVDRIEAFSDSYQRIDRLRNIAYDDSTVFALGTFTCGFASESDTQTTPYIHVGSIEDEYKREMQNTLYFPQDKHFREDSSGTLSASLVVKKLTDLSLHHMSVDAESLFQLFIYISREQAAGELAFEDICASAIMKYYEAYKQEPSRVITKLVGQRADKIDQFKIFGYAIPGIGRMLLSRRILQHPMLPDVDNQVETTLLLSTDVGNKSLIVEIGSNGDALEADNDGKLVSALSLESDQADNNSADTDSTPEICVTTKTSATLLEMLSRITEKTPKLGRDEVEEAALEIDAI